jgi:hypothetical protein
VSCGPGTSWQTNPSWGPNCTPAWWLYPGCLQGGCDPAPCTPWPPCYQNPPTSGWLPDGPLPPLAAPAWGGMSQQQPQQIVSGGPCCQGCADGGSCDCGPSAPVVGAVYVSDDELDALGAEIAKMGSDVDVAAKTETSNFANKVATGAAMTACRAAGLKWDKAGNKCLQEPDPTGASYIPSDANLPLVNFQLQRWTPFQIKWNDYRAQTIHEPTVYDTLRTEFSTLRDEWTGPLKQTTRAVVPARPPSGFTMSTLPWGWIILGGAVLLLPFYLPALTGLYLYFTKGRSGIAKLVAP